MNTNDEIILELATESPDCDPLSFATVSHELPSDEGDLNSRVVITWNRFSLTAAVQKFIGVAMVEASAPGTVNVCKLLAMAVIVFGIDPAKAMVFQGDEENVMACIERGPGSLHFLNMEKCKKLIPDEPLLKALLSGLKNDGFLKESDGQIHLAARGFSMFRIGKK